VQTAKQPDQYQNRDRNPQQPQQQVTSHVGSPLCEREHACQPEVPNTLEGLAKGTKTARCAFLLAMGRVREPRSNYVGEDSKMNQNPNQKPGQQQQGGQQQGGQQGGQQKPGQQQQGGQREKPGQQGGQQGGQQQDR
jgi:hypothetical protein